MISDNLYSFGLGIKSVVRTNSNHSKVAAKDEEPYFDLNKELTAKKQVTFFMRVNTNAMREAGIYKKDIVVVDRSLKACSGHVIIANINGEMLIRRFEKYMHQITLHTNSNDLAPINIADDCKDFSIWGVVTYVIYKR